MHTKKKSYHESNRSYYFRGVEFRGNLIADFKGITINTAYTKPGKDTMGIVSPQSTQGIFVVTT